MKKISILIPCYNEEENVGPISEAVVETLERDLPEYDYELVFIDNDSTDQTRPILRKICSENPRIKAIFNAKNFGQFNSPYYGMLQCTGDCVISMVADFQDPVDMIPKYVHEWENGYKIVIGIKTGSKENPIMYALRSCYYKMIKKLSDVEQIEHFTGSGLYDRDFIEILRELDDPTPFLRGIVAELGYKRKEIPYIQPQRRAGKTHNNFYRLYDAAMLGGFQNLTAYTKGQIIGDDITYAGVRAEQIIGRLPLGLRGDMRLGMSLEAAKTGSRYTETNRDGILDSVSLYLGGETPFGPVYLGYAYGSGGVSNLYLFVGVP